MVGLESTMAAKKSVTKTFDWVLWFIFEGLGESLRTVGSKATS